MDPKEVVRYTLEAIESVKRRARAAMESRDMIAYSRLMGDLFALECCLVGDATRLLDELDQDEKEVA